MLELGTTDQTGCGPVFVGAHPATQNTLIKTRLIKLARWTGRRRRRRRRRLELELALALALALASRARARVVGRGVVVRRAAARTGRTCNGHGKIEQK